MENSLTITMPFDSHVHGRQGDMLNCVAPMTAGQYAGAIFEPNLNTPVTTFELARAYHEEIRQACRRTSTFKPYTLLYLTDDSDPDDIFNAIKSGICLGVKFYPQHATTNSSHGIGDASTLYTPGTKQFECIQAVHSADGVVQLHCELNFTLDHKPLELDPYDKEAYFFERVMPELIAQHADTKFSCEHLTTSEGADFIRRHCGEYLGCSITPHHLLLDRRDVFRGGIHPHFHCLPPVKREKHRQALVDLLKAGFASVYAGTDSAPHDRDKKESDCCSGGVFTAHNSVEAYAQVFENEGILDWRFEPFMAIHGPQFYGVDVSERTITLVRAPWKVNGLVRYSNDPCDTIWPFGFEKDETKRPVFQWKLAT